MATKITQNYINLLKNSQLFEGYSTQEIRELLNCLSVRVIDYKQDEIIIHQNDPVKDIGIVLNGSLKSMKSQTNGRPIIITHIDQGGYTGVLLASSKYRTSPVYVQAQSDATLLMIPFSSLIQKCTIQCEKHDYLIQNYLNIVADKSLDLHERIDCLVQASVREKIMVYLLRVCKQQRKDTITVPLNRNELAEYLNIDRSALSRELSRMKTGGIIDYKKNCFTIIKKSTY